MSAASAFHGSQVLPVAPSTVKEKVQLAIEIWRCADPRPDRARCPETPPGWQEVPCPLHPGSGSRLRVRFDSTGLHYACRDEHNLEMPPGFDELDIAVLAVFATACLEARDPDYLGALARLFGMLARMWGECDAV